MSEKKSNIHIARPGKNTVRHIEATNEDRVRLAEKFKEQKKYEQEVKEKRFAAIRERRKNRPPSGDGDKGINIEVTSDN